MITDFSYTLLHSSSKNYTSSNSLLSTATFFSTVFCSSSFARANVEMRVVCSCSIAYHSIHTSLNFLLPCDRTGLLLTFFCITH